MQASQESTSTIFSLARDHDDSELRSATKSFPQGGRPRYSYVDWVRGAAILLMLTSHSVRTCGIRSRFQRVAVSNPLDVVSVWLQKQIYLIEPLGSALFLAVAGFTLVITYGRVHLGQPVTLWRKTRLKRAAELAALSWLIFSSRFGIQWPYPFAAAEILYVIGAGIAIAVWVVPQTRRHNLAMVGVSLGIVAATFVAESYPDAPLSFLAQGPGGFLPKLLFLILGCALAKLYFYSTGSWKKATVIGAVVLLAISHAAGELWLRRNVFVEHKQTSYVASLSRTRLPDNSAELFLAKPWGRAYFTRMFASDCPYPALSQAKLVAYKLGLVQVHPKLRPRSYTFWNHTMLGAAYVGVLLVLLFGIASAQYWQKAPRVIIVALGKPVCLLGRNALFIYVFHLVVIAATALLVGRHKFPLYGVWAYCAGLTALCLMVSLAKEKIRSRRLAD